LGRCAADDYALAIADEADTIDRTGQVRVRGFNDSDGLGTYHGDRGRLIDMAADRLPSARQHETSIFDRRLDDVCGADEFGHEAAPRREIDLAWRADLRNRALAHDNDAVA